MRSRWIFAALCLFLVGAVHAAGHGSDGGPGGRGMQGDSVPPQHEEQRPRQEQIRDTQEQRSRSRRTEEQRRREVEQHGDGGSSGESRQRSRSAEPPSQDAEDPLRQ